MKDFRNKPNPVKFRIIYLRGALEVGHVTSWCINDDVMMT